MNASDRTTTAPRRSTPLLRRSLAVLAAASLFGLVPARAALADAPGPAADKGYEPTPAWQRAPTAAEEAAMRQRVDQENADVALAGLPGAERERAEMAALGFDPDDPVALNAYREANDVDPHAITATGDFFLNTAWGNGGLNPDRYASADSGTYQGIKAAMLSTGETVVLGSVKFTPDGLLNLGLTKRAANGNRVAWSGVAAQYSLYGGQYILYPRTDTTLPSVYSVHDVKVYADRIYVLYTGHLTDPSTYAPIVTCFNADGSGCGWWFAAYHPGQITNDAVAMDFYGGQFVVLGRHSIGQTGGFWTWKGDVDGAGSLQNFVFTDFPAPGGYDRSEPADVAFRRTGGLIPIAGSRAYYVLFTKKYSADTSSDDYDPCLLAVRSNNEPDTTFDINGVRCMPFDETDSPKTDRAVAMTTNGWGLPTDPHEGVQVLVSVSRSVDDGIGIWELLDRANHPRFGATSGAAGAHGRGNGRVVIGGCGMRSTGNQGEGCLFLTRSARHVGRDLANVGDDMVVAGLRYGNGLLIGSGRYNSSLIARVHGDSGELRQFTTFASGYSEGWFNSLVARNDQDLIGIGTAIDSAVGVSTARTQIMTGLTSNDRIFANGFD